MSRIRRICLALVLFFCAAAAWAETTFYVGFSETLGWADIREYVYLYPSYQKLSELDWDAHKVPQLGMELEFTHNRFFFTADVAASGSADCGYMQDYDWYFADPSKPNPHHYPENTLTHFSEHPVTLQEKNQIDVHAGWKVAGNKAISLSLGGGFQYLRTALEAHDGHYNYPLDGNNLTPYDEEDPNRDKGNLYGPGIDYQLDVESLWLDARVDYNPFRSLAMTLEGGISPWQLLRQDDWHLLRSFWFYDNPLTSVMYRAKASIGYAFSDNDYLFISGSILSLPYSDGNSYCYNTVNQEFDLYSGQIGGTGYFGWDVSLSYRIRIF